MKQKFKILLEKLLEKLHSKQANFVSNSTTKFRRIVSRKYPQWPFLRPLISLCNFIIVRTNGNEFIEFELSNICNARCVFCPYPDMLKTDKKFMHMSRTILEKVKGQLPKFNGSMVSFTPTTGDTLLHPEWDTFMLEVLQLKSIKRATIFTNAIELDEEGRKRLLNLLDKDTEEKLSQLYFSVGGYTREDYKLLYQVDRFDKVMDNLHQLIHDLIQSKKSIGVHIHVKLKSGEKVDIRRAMKMFNPKSYPFVYISHSSHYWSNDGYKRNAILSYYSDEIKDKSKACAYLYKTRFAADGNVWADGCVISEMPGDSSLMLGQIDDEVSVLNSRRTKMIEDWEKNAIIPKPCQGCTLYRNR